MKRIQLEKPYENFYGYKIWHKKEGRFYMCLLPINGGKRHTIAYARYLMAVKLGRRLTAKEQVDHIDGNKINDIPDNLQILSVNQNNRKSIIERGRSEKLIVLTCPVCYCRFSKPERTVRFHTKHGRVLSCSRSCGSKKRWL